jgi:hypothetical protein
MGNELVKGVTLEDLQKAIPSRKNTITEEAVELINRSLTEPEFQGESLLQTAVTYENVLKGTKASLVEYLNAIRFVAYMTSMEDNYTEAYKKVFFDREFVKERMNEPTESNKYKELTSAASRYRKSKLVVDVLTLSQVPFDLMFTGAKFKMIDVLIDIALHGKHDKDRVAAADKVLVHTTTPSMKLDLSVGPNQAAMEMQERLNSQLAALAMNQKRQIEMGMDIRDVQRTGIDLNTIEGEYDEKE